MRRHFSDRPRNGHDVQDTGDSGAPTSPGSKEPAHAELPGAIADRPVADPSSSRAGAPANHPGLEGGPTSREVRLQLVVGDRPAAPGSDEPTHGHLPERLWEDRPVDGPAGRAAGASRWPRRGHSGGVDEDARDAADAAALRAGDSAAYEIIVRRYWPVLCAYADRVLGDVDEGCDVAQEVLVRLWERRAELTDLRSLRAFLLRLTRNLAIDALRRRHVRNSSRRGAERIPAAPPDELAEERQLVELVERAIQALPPRRREVFTLVHLQHLSHHDAASVMGVSVQTVANHMSAALADLRRALEPVVGNPAPRRPRD